MTSQPAEMPIQTAGENVGAVVAATAPAPQVASTNGTRIFVWSLLIAAGGTFLYVAAQTGSPAKSLLAAGAVIAVWLAVGAVRAHGRAELAAMMQYAGHRGFEYIGYMELLERTPLLAAGERSKCANYIEGPLTKDLPGVAFGMGHYTFETYEEVRTKRNNTVEAWTPHKMTVCVVEIPEMSDRFPEIYAIRRRGVFKSFSGTTWLDFEELRAVELESEALRRRFDIYVEKGLSDNTLLRIFKPTFQVWLADLPTELYFEYRLGCLVTYRFKHEDVPVELDAQIHATAHIAIELHKALK